jgi:hypothetical protein
LSCLCKWAVHCAKIDRNPFAGRTRFAKTKRHCHEVAPDCDETLHKILGWLFEVPQLSDKQKERGDKPDHSNVLAGGLLAFCALTGLRSGEPSFLQRVPTLAEVPRYLKTLPAGTIYPDMEGTLRMKVIRTKRGQNPSIKLHPAALDFLSTWRAYMAKHHPDSSVLFPLGTDDKTTLNRALNTASNNLELPHYTPHGFGRAYYVKVRRSQGADDATIAGELGQTTNGELIRSVYGDPDDQLGGSLFDWLPEDSAPTWNLLNQLNPDTNLIRPNSGMIRQEAGTCATPQTANCVQINPSEGEKPQ